MEKEITLNELEKNTVEEQKTDDSTEKIQEFKLTRHVLFDSIYLTVAFIVCAFVVLYPFNLSLGNIVDIVIYNPKIIIYVMTCFAVIYLILFIVTLSLRARPNLLVFNLKKTVQWRLFPLVMLSAFIIWASLSMFFSQNKKLALWDYGSRGEGLIMYYAYMIIFISAFILKKDFLKNIIITAFIILSLYICIFMTLDHYVFKYGENMVWWQFSAPWYHFNHSGYFLSISAILSATWFILNKKLWIKILSMTAFVYNVVISILNDSFGSQLTIIIALITMAILLLCRDKKCWLDLLYIFAGLVVGCSIGLILEVKTLGIKPFIYNFIKFKEDVATITTNSASKAADDAGTARWVLWKECFKNMIEYPLFGIGINCQRIENPSIHASRPHNEPLQFGSTMGIPALVFYMSALIGVFILVVKQLKKISKETLACLITAFTYFVSSLFGVSLPYTFIFYMLFLGLGMNGFDYYTKFEKKEKAKTSKFSFKNLFKNFKLKKTDKKG